jgi:hypothetical protein
MQLSILAQDAQPQVFEQLLLLEVSSIRKLFPLIFFLPLVFPFQQRQF